MIIKISNLSDGVHNYNFNDSIAELGLSEPFYDNFIVDVELNKSHSQIVLDSEILLKAKFECDRCSDDYNAELKTKYRMVYLFGKEPVENDLIDISYLPLEADKIDITKDVRDYSLLAIPMKKLCNEDCKGLCARCGKNLNEGDCNCSKNEIDPRWLPLQELKNKLNIN